MEQDGRNNVMIFLTVLCSCGWKMEATDTGLLFCMNPECKFHQVIVQPVVEMRTVMSTAKVGTVQ